MPNKDPEKRKAYNLAYRSKNKERINAKMAQYYIDNRDEKLKKAKEYRESNKEKISINKKEYHKKNSEARKLYGAEYYKKNRDEKIRKAAEYRPTHYANNKSYYVEKTNKRRRHINMVSWDSEREQINLFYKNCPKGFHVDHVIPLKGKNVSGLHVLSNLQYLHAKENLSKRNKFMEESA